MDELPSYDPGLHIQETTHSNSSLSSLIVVNGGTGGEYDHGDVLTGRIIITGSSKHDTEINTILIDFQQFQMFNRKGKWTTRQLILTKYDIPIDAYPPDNIIKKNHQYEFTFSLTIPSRMHKESCYCSSNNSTEILTLHRQLPPTVGTPFIWCDQGPDVPDKSVVIAYRLRTRVLNPKGILISKHNKYIRLSPSYPPLSLPFDPDIITKVELKKKKATNIFAEKGSINLLLKFNHVPVLFLDQNNGVADLRLSMEYDDDELLPTIRQLYYKLTAFTTSNIQPIGYYPDITDRKVHCVKDTFQLARVVHWEFENNNNSILIFRIRIPSTKEGICPSYYSCSSSRQYKIKLTIEFEKYHNISTADTPLIIAQSATPRYYLGNFNNDITLGGINRVLDVDDDDVFVDPCPPYHAHANEFEYEFANSL